MIAIIIIICVVMPFLNLIEWANLYNKHISQTFDKADEDLYKKFDVDTSIETCRECGRLVNESGACQFCDI